MLAILMSQSAISAKLLELDLRIRSDCTFTSVATTVRQYGSHPTSDLLGVDYFYRVPADTEFPKLIPQLDLFVRFRTSDLVRPVRLLLTLSYLDEQGDDRLEVYRREVTFSALTPPGEYVVPRSYKLTGLSAPGEGIYCVRILRRTKRSWDNPTGWRVLKADYFAIVRG